MKLDWLQKRCIQISIILSSVAKESNPILLNPRMKKIRFKKLSFWSQIVFLIKLFLGFIQIEDKFNSLNGKLSMSHLNILENLISKIEIKFDTLKYSRRKKPLLIIKPEKRNLNLDDDYNELGIFIQVLFWRKFIEIFEKKFWRI